MGVKGQIAWNKGIKGSVKPNITSFKPGLIPWNKGKVGVMPEPWNKGLTGLPARHTTPHSEETKKKVSETFKMLWAEGRYKNRFIDYAISSKKSSETQRTGSYKNCKNCNKEFYAHITSTRKYCSKKCQGEHMIGEKSCRWAGGINARPYKHLKTKAYRDWRTEVFKRDNYTCQDCGNTKEFLHGHHIKSYTKFKELRHEVSNGLTLCIKCHIEYHRNTRIKKFLS